MTGRKHRHMENRILRDYFDTERNLQEKQSVSVCDGYTELETIELGTHDIPKWIWQELNQAIHHLIEGTIPIFIAHEKGTPYDDSIVMMRLSDYARMRHLVIPSMKEGKHPTEKKNERRALPPALSRERTHDDTGRNHSSSMQDTRIERKEKSLQDFSLSEIRVSKKNNNENGEQTPADTSTALPLYNSVWCTCGERLTTFEQVNQHRRRGCYAE